jgi:HSP20 family protein
MSIIPRNALFDIDSVFENFFAPSNRVADAKNNFFSPRIDIKDNGDHYDISAELAGVDKDDIHVTLENGILSIEAESKQEDKEEKDGKVIRQERRYGKFVRSFSVGNNVQEKDIEATFKNGVLHLKAPKAKIEAETTKRISIK